MAFSLIPRNDKYFEDFDQAIGIVREMARLLRAGVEQPKIPADLWKKMKEEEARADKVVRLCLSRLDASFITPIEREDIHMLTVTIDDVADALEAASSRFDMFAIEEPTEELRKIVAAIDEMVEQLVIVVRELRTLQPAPIREATARVDVLEERVDDLFREAQRALFNRHPEAYDLVRWKEVYDHLELASDYGRKVARTVNHILVRHS